MSQRLFQLLEILNGLTTDDGLLLSARLQLEGSEGLQVGIQDREELPILITLDDEQILCTTQLWREREIHPERRAELHEVLLALNLSMPLSSFAKIGDHYILFGALSVRATDEELIEEIRVLSDNALSALDFVQDYLVE